MESKISGRLHIVIKRMAYVWLFVGVCSSVALGIYTIKMNYDLIIPLLALLSSILFFYLVLGFAKIVEAADKYIKQ